ncbi:DUF3857 domain-containing protein [Flaviaesturariibacter terrae]
MSVRTTLLASALLLLSSAHGQKRNQYKFEKIDAAALSRTAYPLDSNAAAVVIADVGDTRIEGNNKGWFSFVFRRHRRVHVLKKSAYDAATVEIPVYHDGFDAEERIENIKAVSYNLTEGKVAETKLARDQIFKETVSKNVTLYKFTLPAVREGSIIDIEYSIKSDYLNTLQPWDFQGTYPMLWSEYTLSVPQFFDYMFIYKGYVPFLIVDKLDRQEQFNIVDQGGTGPTERSSFLSGATDYRWVAANVAAFQDEPFLSARANYQAHMDFQLSAYRYPVTAHNFIPTWPEKTAELLKDENFGRKIDRNNPWLNDVMKPLEQGSPLAQAQAIHAWVRDHIQCDNQRGIYLRDQLKDVFRAGKGSVSEINLLLVTMLRHAGLDANPVMLSTRDNGTVFTAFPMLSRFNYIIASVTIDDKKIMLDASRPRLGFGQLLPDCYNGIARVISPGAEAIFLLSDSLVEKRMTLAFLPQKGDSWDGTFNRVMGNYESYELRNRVAEKGRDVLYSELRDGIGNDYRVLQPAVDSLGMLEKPLSLHAELKRPVPTEGPIYFDPMLGEGVRENPFKSSDRIYPIEMPFARDYTYLLTLEIPEGYEIDELPKPLRVSLNDKNDGSFEYLLSVNERLISLRSRIRIRRASYRPEDYADLREFFDLIVAKHKEKIVFRKKK